MPTPPLTLTALAHQTAAQIGFPLRRWWRERTSISATLSRCPQHACRAAGLLLCLQGRSR